MSLGRSPVVHREDDIGHDPGHLGQNPAVDLGQREAIFDNSKNLL